MKNIGILLMALGAGSFVLNFIGMEFKLLMWIDNWGQMVGWAIRGAMIVVGGLLVFLSMKPAAAPAPIEEPQISSETPPPAENI